jgi:hypothetical protein
MVPINVTMNHWALVIILNPLLYVKEKNVTNEKSSTGSGDKFEIIICDSAFVDDMDKFIKKQKECLSKILLWIRNEWFDLNNIPRNQRNDSIFLQYNLQYFKCSSQSNVYDCGIFVCAYAYETIQWYLNEMLLNPEESIHLRLQMVDQLYVNRLRVQITKLILYLEKVKRCSSEVVGNGIISKLDYEDDSNTQCHTYVNNLKTVDTIDVYNTTNEEVEYAGHNLCETNSNIVGIRDFDDDMKETYEDPECMTRTLHSNTDELTKYDEYLINEKVELLSIESGEINIDATYTKSFFEDIPDVVRMTGNVNEVTFINEHYFKNNYETIEKKKKTNDEDSTTRIVIGSVLQSYNNIMETDPSAERCAGKSASNNSYAVSCYHEISVESNKATEPICTGLEESYSIGEYMNDDMSTISNSQDTSLRTNVSSGSTPSRKRRRQHALLSYTVPLLDSSNMLLIEKIRFILIIECDTAVFENLINDIGRDYERFRDSRLQHSFQFFMTCNKNDDNCHYSPISEKILMEAGVKSYVIFNWKKLCFEYFLHCREEGHAVRIEYDDVRDYDFWEFYSNRGKLSRANMYYHDASSQGFHVAAELVNVHQIYYNPNVDTYFAIQMMSNNTTTIREYTTEQMSAIYSTNFCDDIKIFWTKKNVPGKQQFYARWPGQLQIKPSGLESLTTPQLHFLVNEDEVSAFVVVANVLHLKGLESWAYEIYNYRTEFKIHLQKHLNMTDGDREINYTRRKELRSKDVTYHTPMLFMKQKLLFEGERGSYQAKLINCRFNLNEQRQIMLEDEFIIICLKSNDCVIGITKDYMITSAVNRAIPYSTKMLDEFSFGKYIGIRSGVYMHKREGKVNWMKETPHICNERKASKVCYSQLES